YRMKPPVRGGELRSHKIVVVKVGVIVVAHRTDAIGVVERRHQGSGVVPGSPDESIQSSRQQANRIVVIPIHMTLIPGRARVFDALRNKVIRSNWAIGIEDAIAGRRRTGVATRDGWRRPLEGRRA